MERKILSVDDDVGIREVMRTLLEGEGYRVDEVVDGISAVSMADDTYDLIIPDVMMPGRSGFSACAEIRKKSVVSILFLTARTQDSDRTMGFGAGGDDYLAKLFSYMELAVRVKVMIRRYHVHKGKMEEKEDGAVTAKDLTIQKVWNEVGKVGEELLLADLEHRTLLLSVCNRRRMFTIGNIYEDVWEEPFFYSTNNTVMAHIWNLRKKLEANPKNPKYMVNVWGKGHRVE